MWVTGVQTCALPIFMSTAPKGNNTEQTEPTMNNAQIKLQVEKANKILNGFVPPLKGGG